MLCRFSGSKTNLSGPVGGRATFCCIICIICIMSYVVPNVLKTVCFHTLYLRQSKPSYNFPILILYFPICPYMHSKVMHILYVFIHKFILFIYLFPPIHFWTASEMQFIIFNKVVDRVPPQTLVQSAPMYMSQLGKVNWTPCTLEIWGIFNKKKQGGDFFFM